MCSGNVFIKVTLPKSSVAFLPVCQARCLQSVDSDVVKEGHVFVAPKKRIISKKVRSILDKSTSGRERDCCFTQVRRARCGSFPPRNTHDILCAEYVQRPRTPCRLRVRAAPHLNLSLAAVFGLSAPRRGGVRFSTVRPLLSLSTPDTASSDAEAVGDRCGRRSVRRSSPRVRGLLVTYLFRTSWSW